MITDQKLPVYAYAAKSIVGMSLEAFDKLCKEIPEAHDQRMEQESHTRYSGEPPAGEDT